jgi:acetyltransferase-like isoleucine patch superfamily enzyme
MKISSFKQVLYLIVRDLQFFSWPGLRQLRNTVYGYYLNARDLNVDAGVHIAKAHHNPEARVEIGESFRIGLDAKIDLTGGLIVGKNVTVSEGAKIFTHEHVIDGPHEDWRKNGIRFSPLILEDYAWIGANAIVTAAVTRVGKGAVVAAGALVTKDVEDFAVVGGVPARHLRYRSITS